MKRAIVNFSEMTEYNNLYNAWRLCSTGDGKKNRCDVKAFGANEKKNLLSLQRRLRDGTWKPDKGRVFYLKTEKKVREIHVVGIEDRIVHQLLVKFFRLDRHFVKRTFGSIKGRGTLKASKQVRQDIHRSGYNLCVKLDVKRYYPNINKSKLMEMIRRKYKGERALSLLEAVIMSYKPETDLSISIGALTSQNNGNFYLTPLDYFVLQELGARYYTRYVDDIVILVKDKREAKMIIRRASEFISGLGLTFGKITLFPIDKRRIDFCSYAVGTENTRVRASIKYRFIHKLRQLTKRPQNGIYERSCVCSYLGYFKYCDSNNLLKDLKNEYNEVFNRVDRFAKGRRGKEDDASGAEPTGERVPTLLQPSRRRARRGKNRRGQRGTRCRVSDYTCC
jgi:retron-type reverse transcriptase